jgi:fused signal recognition particle receptor
MVFNWFRRKFDEQKEDATVETAEPETAIAESVIPPESQDLLNWAKTAYANIQSREEVVTSEEVAETTQIVEIGAYTQAPSSNLVEIITAPEIEETPEELVEAVLEPVINQEPLPFWAQSESDRQARIAALAATAIPEIIVEEPTLEIIQEIPEQIPFDDGFLWSAQVLASQGRRPQDIASDEITWLQRLRQGLDKTRLSLVNQLKSLVGKGPLNAEAVDEIESLLLQADVGVKATDLIIQKLQAKIREEILPPDEAIAFLKQILQEILDQPLKTGKISPRLAPDQNQLNVWLITGVNGAGKTTTIGKLAHLAKQSGYNTLIAAADTFRAAAVQQVQVWGDRAQVEVIANIGKNTDPAAVVFDAIIAAQARGTELLLVDTAGRLQNKQNLMDELSKIRRIVDKKAAGANIESLLVLDASLGQNGLKQAEVFSKSAGVSGVVLTKLDGTAKGGVAIAVVQQLGLPIRFIGAGEGIDDLRPFSSYEFVEALLSN